MLIGAPTSFGRWFSIFNSFWIFRFPIFYYTNSLPYGFLTFQFRCPVFWIYGYLKTRFSVSNFSKRFPRLRFLITVYGFRVYGSRIHPIRCRFCCFSINIEFHSLRISNFAISVVTVSLISCLRFSENLQYPVFAVTVHVLTHFVPFVITNNESFSSSALPSRPTAYPHCSNV